MEDSNRVQLREMSQSQEEINLFPEGTLEEWGMFSCHAYCAQSSLVKKSTANTFTPLQTQPGEEWNDVWQRPNILHADA